MNERLGLPSASKATRWLACAGSVLAESQFPDETSVAGIDGTRRHDILAGIPVEGATPEDYEICDELRALEHSVLDEWADTHQVTGIICTRETRMKLRDDKKRVIATGKPDAIYLGQCGKKTVALVVDYKTGHGLVATQENAQLATLAVMAKQEMEVEEASYAILQRNVTPVIETLLALDLKVWEQKLFLALDRATDKSARRTAGQWCLYCKAAGSCPEAHSATRELSVRGSEIMDITKMPELLNACLQAEGVIDAVRAKARTLLKDGLPIEGWALRDESRRSITCDSTAMERVVQGVGKAIASECVDFSLSRLEKALSKDLGKKEAKAKADALLAGLIERRNITKLVRTK